MQVEVNNQDLISLPLLGHVIFGTDEACDVVLQSETQPKSKFCSIINDKTVCIIEVFNGQEITINQLPIHEMAILQPGDVIHIGQHQLKIIDENNLPKSCSVPFKINNDRGSDNYLITSVSGLRSFNKGNYGEITIVGDKNSFTHKPLTNSDVPFSVSYIEENLTLLCKKDKTIRINGNKANYATLKNGDMITTPNSKYSVESPGTSAFSKYSPSHPRNIQLSEEYLTEGTTGEKNPVSFIKNNLWWITLLVGLVVITTILIVLKNS